MRTWIKTLLSRSVPLLLGLVGVVGVAHAANWNIRVDKTSPTSANLSFDAEPWGQFNVCWKLASAGGDVCGAYGHRTEVVAWVDPPIPEYVNGRMNVRLHSLATCGVDYKVRVRRTLLAFDTYVFRFPC